APMLNSPTADPFPGLRAFDSTESEQFFGRHEDIDNAVQAIAAKRLVVIVGRSGCGKTSLVQAGSPPTMPSPPWAVLLTRPGSEPLANLAEAIAQQDDYARAGVGPRSSADLAVLLGERPDALANILDSSASADNRNRLLVVDQFEEIFRAPTDSFD